MPRKPKTEPSTSADLLRDYDAWLQNPELCREEYEIWNGLSPDEAAAEVKRTGIPWVTALEAADKEHDLRPLINLLLPHVPSHFRSGLTYLAEHKKLMNREKNRPPAPPWRLFTSAVQRRALAVWELKEAKTRGEDKEAALTRIATKFGLTEIQLEDAELGKYSPDVQHLVKVIEAAYEAEDPESFTHELPDVLVRMPRKPPST